MIVSSMLHRGSVPVRATGGRADDLGPVPTPRPASCATSWALDRTYDAGRLHADLAAFTSTGAALGYVAPMADHLAPDGREDVVRKLVMLADAFGPQATPAATAAVDEIAAALQLSPAHVAGIRQQVLAGRPGGGAA